MFITFGWYLGIVSAVEWDIVLYFVASSPTPDGRL